MGAQEEEARLQVSRSRARGRPGPPGLRPGRATAFLQPTFDSNLERRQVGLIAPLAPSHKWRLATPAGTTTHGVQKAGSALEPLWSIQLGLGLGLALPWSACGA